ncbi:MAG: hypothetical protein QXI60_11715 [Thermofilaceae archaeon]
MVENVNPKSERRGSENNQTTRILEIPHYPTTGGVRTLSVDKAGDGGYVIRIAYANKRENRNEVQAMKLDEMEVAYLALRLLMEVTRFAK